MTPVKTVPLLSQKHLQIKLHSENIINQFGKLITEQRRKDHGLMHPCFCPAQTKACISAKAMMHTDML